MSRQYTKVEALSEEQKRNNELVELRMQVELLRNFCPKLGGGEAEIPGDRALSRKMSDRNDVPYV